MKAKQISIQQLKEKGGVNFHIATINKEPKWFIDHFGYSFKTLEDDLESFLFSPLTIGDAVFGLYQYSSEKGKGVAVYVEKTTKQKLKLLEKVIHALDLEMKDLSWKHASAGGVLVRRFMEVVNENLQSSNPLIQILTGPRQVGKTTGAKYIIEHWSGRTIFETADGSMPKSEEWLANIWAQASQGENTLLVIDEFQKITNWSSTLKFLWDKQVAHSTSPSRIKLLLLGSNSLFMNKNLNESLAGRFELTQVPHWNFDEYHAAFGTTFEEYLLFGGYPKAAHYIGDFDKWSNYLLNSIITPVVTVDIPFSSKKNSQKVAQFLDVLGRHLGEVTPYSLLAHELPSLTNSKVVKEYLELFEGVFFCKRLDKVTAKRLRRETSPLILPLFTSFLSFFSRLDHFRTPMDKEKYLRVAVGQRLFEMHKGSLGYWKEGYQEIDYVYEYNGNKYALQVCEHLDASKKKSIELFKKEFLGGKSVQISEVVFKLFSQNPDYFLETMAI